MPKCERSGYSEPPFFRVEDDADSPYAVAWFPLKLRDAFAKLLAHWPDRLEVHLEILEDDFETVEFEAFGNVGRGALRRVLDEHAETVFADGGVRLRVWRSDGDGERCLGLDEHGVLYVWEEPERLRAWLGGELGAEERDAPLPYEADHDHHIPEDADLKRARLVSALGLEER